MIEIRPSAYVGLTIAMAFQGLDHLLAHLHQELPQRATGFSRLVQDWPQLVGAALTLHTRPHRLDRQILKVATSSNVWAQHLQFERHRLRAKIEQQVGLTLKDIHFSTAHWLEQPQDDRPLASQLEQDLWHHHPSRRPLPIAPQSPTLPPRPRTTSATPLGTIVQTYAQHCQHRDRFCVPCPRCHSPTPPGELDRWHMCSFCVSHQWH